MSQGYQRVDGNGVNQLDDALVTLVTEGAMRMLESALGGYMIVGLMSDEDITRWKRPPILNLEDRTAVVAACKFVDEAIPNAPWIIDADWIALHNIDLVVHGDDYTDQELKFSHNVPIEMGIFRSIPYTPGISTTQIIMRCKEAELGSERPPS